MIDVSYSNEDIQRLVNNYTEYARNLNCHCITCVIQRHQYDDCVELNIPTLCKQHPYERDITIRDIIHYYDAESVYAYRIYIDDELVLESDPSIQLG